MIGDFLVSHPLSLSSLESGDPEYCTIATFGNALHLLKVLTVLKRTRPPTLMHPAYPRPKRTMFDLWKCIIQITRWLLSLINELWRKTTAPTIEFDTGRSVRLGKQIAEGGFSYVFEAFDRAGTKYALKRINVGELEELQGCLREAGVHRSLRHPNLMPLLGICQEKLVVYLLFPYMQQSLRSVVNKSIFETHPAKKAFSELQVLQLIHQIMSGVAAMHEANYSHRDIKLENVLLDSTGSPVLMDFGSVGRLEERVSTRQDVLNLIENASQHTTLAYRPPELLDGGIRSGDEPVDFVKVDVWSLGCTLFAMCFGASPFECEFRNDEIRVVECTALRILGNVPTPTNGWYSSLLLETIKLLLTPDRFQRPNLDEAMVEIEALIQKLGGRVPQVVRKGGGEDDDSDLDALLSSNRFV